MKAQRKMTKTGARVALAAPRLQIVPTETKTAHGVKLRTLSMLTMLFALICLGAFLAGRPPLSAAGAGASGRNDVPMFIGLRLATYPVRNLAEAKAWYSTVLGVEPYADDPSFAGFRTGAGELDLVPAAKVRGKKAALQPVYWGVANARTAYQRLVDLGAKPRQPIREADTGILAGTVEDPFGNILVVVQNRHVE